MPVLHIANTFFENELEEDLYTLDQALHKNSVILQLQFLPLLYAEKEDGVLVTDYPEKEYIEQLEKEGFTKLPCMCLLKDVKFPFQKLESWGASNLIDAWGRVHHLTYEKPPWEVVKEVNSKAFSFTHAPKLPNAALLSNLEELEEWLSKPFSPKVLKSCYGVSGRGHFFSHDKSLKQFAEKEFKKGLPVIGEPWMTRILDFSTQWKIDEGSISYLGLSICENNPRGMYRGNIVDNSSSLPEPFQPFFDEHLFVARKMLRKIAALKYFGNVGIDAFLFKNGEKIELHPITEINARKTMGWVLLKIREKYFQHGKIGYHFSKATSSHSLLPPHLKVGRKKMTFAHQLEFIR